MRRLKSRNKRGSINGQRNNILHIRLDGLDLSGMTVGSKISLGEGVILEVTQIGKEDHPSIVNRTYGVSLLPGEGLFCKVIKGG
ncbi:MAG TPA: hypothetical protein VEG39_08610 [Clostridia bacterium]|nr:hypothetical protein [Clostridia bacterium]